ncbi:MAG: D-alanyl-D-alanine carboxypeptidase [Planctomycetes bacterium]|nr:D-alanyl-D-alanine carboxypeptidase [Planctomycetota bacterium]
MFRSSALAAAAALVLVAAPQPGAADSPRLALRLAQAFANNQKGIDVTACVWDAQTWTVVAEKDRAVARRPASVMKMATTAAAFLALGPDHELVTEVIAAAPPKSGVLSGPLVVRGHGDPGFAAHFDPRGAEAALRDLARQVAASGVRKVEGGLVLDVTAFGGPERHAAWGWTDGEWGWDQAPVSALPLNDNCVTVSVVPGAGAGAPAAVKLAPATAAARLVNRATTLAPKTRSTVAFGRTQPDGRIPVTGGVPAGSQGFTSDQAIVDPTVFFGDVFARLLREEGVSGDLAPVVVRSPSAPAAGGPAVVARPVSRSGARSGGGAALLARHGTKVRDIAAVANRRSQNLYAELLGRELGRAKAGDGSFEGGARAVTAALGFAAGDPQFRASDGSGYSRENRVSAEAVGSVLRKIMASPHGELWMSTLARPGEDGTLERRYTAAKYKGRIFAKTGTLRDTKALAGFVRAKSGRLYAFCVLCEGDNGRAIALHDDVVEALADEE